MSGYSIQRDGHVTRSWVILHQNMMANLMKIFCQQFLAMNFPKAKPSYRIKSKHFQAFDCTMMQQMGQLFNRRLMRDGNALVLMANGAESHF